MCCNDLKLLNSPFLCAFAKELGKATANFVMFVPGVSVRMEYLGSHWTDFREISYLFTEILKKVDISISVLFIKEAT